MMMIMVVMVMGDGVGVRSLLYETFCLQICLGKGLLPGFVWEMEIPPDRLLMCYFRE